MRILKTSRFARDAITEGLTDVALKAAIKEFEEGLTGNALGGNLYKKRVAVGSKGKSGGCAQFWFTRLPTIRCFASTSLQKTKEKT